MEQGMRWTVQDYFSRTAYMLFGRKDKMYSDVICAVT